MPKGGLVTTFGADFRRDRVKLRENAALPVNLEGRDAIVIMLPGAVA